MSRAYQIGDGDLDRRIKELVSDAGGEANADLVGEMMVTNLKLIRDRTDRGDLKLINAALKEMRYSFLLFSRYQHIRKVAVFGSARIPSDDENFRLAAEFARHMTEERGWMVITGAGPGIMEAANAGAGPHASFGVNIRLPFESEANPHVLPNRLVNFKYFFTRKLIFVKEAHAFALFPGGFGTLDETFELLTLVQTGKSDLHPIVMVESPATDYWGTWVDFVNEDLVGNGLISPHDLSLFKVVKDVEEACEELSGFYANYHSQRFVEGKLVLRMQRAPESADLAALNEEFSDIVADGEIEQVAAAPAELADHDHPELERLALTFDRRQFGRLRQLVDRLNLIPTDSKAQAAPDSRVMPEEPID
ncbi:MAG: TIGR00730 family Rossman fold protein [Actinomycetota bacterium]|nr:TIGR00730 family Rossman fold protein [Actinomycetota bacterium]